MVRKKFYLIELTTLPVRSREWQKKQGSGNSYGVARVDKLPHKRNTEIAEGARTQVSEQYREPLQRRSGWRNKSETTLREHSPSRADHPPRTLLRNTQTPRPHLTSPKQLHQCLPKKIVPLNFKNILLLLG